MIQVKLGQIKDEDRKSFAKAVIDYNFYGMLTDDEAESAVSFIVNTKLLGDARLKLHEMVDLAYTREAISFEEAEAKEKRLRSDYRKATAKKVVAA